MAHDKAVDVAGYNAAERHAKNLERFKKEGNAHLRREGFEREVGDLTRGERKTLANNLGIPLTIPRDLLHRAKPYLKHTIYDPETRKAHGGTVKKKDKKGYVKKYAKGGGVRKVRT